MLFYSISASKKDPNLLNTQKKRKLRDIYDEGKQNNLSLIFVRIVPISAAYHVSTMIKPIWFHY